MLAPGLRDQCAGRLLLRTAQRRRRARPAGARGTGDQGRQDLRALRGHPRPDAIRPDQDRPRGRRELHDAHAALDPRRASRRRLLPLHQPRLRPRDLRSWNFDRAALRGQPGAARGQFPLFGRAARPTGVPLRGAGRVRHGTFPRTRRRIRRRGRAALGAAAAPHFASAATKPRASSAWRPAGASSM